MSPAESKLFPGGFNFPISNLDHPALIGAYHYPHSLSSTLTNLLLLLLLLVLPGLGLNTQLQQSGELAVSPQGESEHFSIYSIVSLYLRSKAHYYIFYIKCKYQKNQKI